MRYCTPNNSPKRSKTPVKYPTKSAVLYTRLELEDACYTKGDDIMRTIDAVISAANTIAEALIALNTPRPPWSGL
jgi:hypothetical protein